MVKKTLRVARFTNSDASRILEGREVTNIGKSRGHGFQKAGTLVMALPHVSGHHAYPEPPGQATSGFHPLAQALQRHQLELSDAIAFHINQGFQSAAIDFEFRAGVVVARFAKTRKSLKPVH